MIKLDSISINEDGTLSIPKKTYEAIAAAARLKYNFKGTSVRTVKKYVTQYLEEAFSEHFVAIPNDFLSKKEKD